MPLWGFERCEWGAVEWRERSRSLMADAEVDERAVRERCKDIEQREQVSELRRECSAWPSAAVAGRGPAATAGDTSGWHERERAHEVSIMMAGTGAVGR